MTAPTTIYNVLINGVSIGMTFNKALAELWASESMSTRKEIREVRYNKPHDISVKVSFAS